MSSTVKRVTVHMSKTDILELYELKALLGESSSQVVKRAIRELLNSIKEINREKEDVSVSQ